MDFITAIRTCMGKKYADFSGRASRSEFWFFALFLFLAGFVSGVVDIMILNYHPDDLGPLNLIVTIITFIPTIAVASRRLHDVNQSGWWQLIVFTIIGIPIYLYWVIIKGTDGDNPYGSDPVVN